MALFGKKESKKSEFRKFSRVFGKMWKVWGKKKSKRGKAAGILSRDMLVKRDKLTQNRTKDLVLQFGRKGGTISYTIDELDKMAAALEKKQGKFKHKENGVEITALLRASRVPVDIDGIRRGATDLTKAKRIRNATLYKIKDQVLHFRVTSSGENPKHTHYQVRVRLEGWESEMVKARNSYIVPAQKACRGRVSFDCSCPRHQYWFRYLATIGKFALEEPQETGFPKIRNPNLLGCACKHMIKVVAVMQSPFVHAKVAKIMAEEAKDTNWRKKAAALLSFDEGTLSETDLNLSEKAGNTPFGKKILDEFSNFNAAKKGMARKIKEDEETQVFLLKRLVTTLLTAKKTKKMTHPEAMESFAVEHNVTMKNVRNLAKGLDI